MSDILELARSVQSIKEEIRTVVEDMGIDIPETTPFSNFPAKISTIERGEPFYAVNQLDENVGYGEKVLLKKRAQEGEILTGFSTATTSTLYKLLPYSTTRFVKDAGSSSYIQSWTQEGGWENVLSLYLDYFDGSSSTGSYVYSQLLVFFDDLKALWQYPLCEIQNNTNYSYHTIFSTDQVFVSYYSMRSNLSYYQPEGYFFENLTSTTDLNLYHFDFETMTVGDKIGTLSDNQSSTTISYTHGQRPWVIDNGTAVIWNMTWTSQQTYSASYESKNIYLIRPATDEEKAAAATYGYEYHYQSFTCTESIGYIIGHTSDYKYWIAAGSNYTTANGKAKIFSISRDETNGDISDVSFNSDLDLDGTPTWYPHLQLLILSKAGYAPRFLKYINGEFTEISVDLASFDWSAITVARQITINKDMTQLYEASTGTLFNIESTDEGYRATSNTHYNWNVNNITGYATGEYSEDNSMIEVQALLPYDEQA